MVEPEWGTRKVADIASEDVDRLLAKAAKGRPRPRKHPLKQNPRSSTMKAAFRPTPVRANRVGEIVRKLFNLASVGRCDRSVGFGLSRGGRRVLRGGY
jgi:hypothetical protein